MSSEADPRCAYLRLVKSESFALTRELFHCPSWCITSLGEHLDLLEGLEGESLHRAQEQELDGHYFAATVMTTPSGHRRGAGVEDGETLHTMPVATAREFAAALVAAADLAESA